MTTKWDNYFTSCQRVLNYLETNKKLLTNSLLKQAYVYLMKQNPHQNTSRSSDKDLSIIYIPENSHLLPLYFAVHDNKLTVSTIDYRASNPPYSRTLSRSASPRDLITAINATINRISAYFHEVKVAHARAFKEQKHEKMVTQKRVHCMKEQHTDFKSMVLDKAK